MSRSECDVKITSAGLEGFSLRDVKLPLLKLKQAGTQDAPRVPDGSWYLTNDPEGHSLSRGLVLLEMRKERSLVLPYAGVAAREAVASRIERATGVHVPLDHEGAVCFSRDRLRPVVLEGVEPLSDQCTTCPMARWRTVAGRRVQDCAESYRLLVWDEGAEAACLLYARGGAIGPVRDFLTNVQVACHRYKLPACGFRFGLSSRRAHSLEGSYWAPLFTRPYLHTNQDAWQQFDEIRRACSPEPREVA